MRKLTAGNKTNFTIFAIIIILIIALLIFCLSRVLNTDKQIYQIDSGTFFYDKDNNPIKLEDEVYKLNGMVIIIYKMQVNKNIIWEGKL